MSTTTEVFADVDRMDAKAFASHLAEDCLLRFGNADEVVGRDAIEEGRHDHCRQPGHRSPRALGPPTQGERDGT